jgi:dTDP-4-amino-4,6-dideoxygalactose transaminase
MLKLYETSISSYYAHKDIAEVIESGNLGFGPNVTKFETMFAPYSYKKHNVAVNSCSAAAFIIFAYLKEKYGTCDVYTPSIGFTSMPWAAKHHGHNVIFVDVKGDMTMDFEMYQWARVTDTGNKAVVMPVMYGGVSTINMEKFLKGDEFIILDSAHCATPRSKSDVALFSFHPYKPITASDGGMISTDIEEIDQFARKYRNFGREPHAEGYTIASEGFKFYMNNLNATIALTQLETYEEKRAIRKEAFEKIQSMNFEGSLARHDDDSSYYVATLIADTVEYAEMMREKYCTDRLYPPMHLQPYYKDCRTTVMSKTEELFDLLVNLPLSYGPDVYNS